MGTAQPITLGYNARAPLDAMTLRPLPGRWFDYTPAPRAVALHPHRPWLALARRDDAGRGIIERIALDTGDITLLAEGSALVADALAWVGDHLAVYGSDGTAFVRLYDGDGNGVIAEQTPFAQGHASVMPHARGVDLLLVAVEPLATTWQPFRFGIARDEVTLRAHPLVVGRETPCFHPDGDRFALADHDGNTSQVVLHAEGVVRALVLPTLAPQGRAHVVGWAGRETLVVCSIVPLTGAPDDGVLVVDGVWSIEIDTGKPHRLFRRGGALPGAALVQRSPDASRLALVFDGGNGWSWLRIVNLATRRASTVRHVLGRSARLPQLHWLDEETLVTLHTGGDAFGTTVRVYKPAKKRTDLYVLPDAPLHVELVANGEGGRLLLKTSEARPRLFVSDRLLPEVATRR